MEAQRAGPRHLGKDCAGIQGMVSLSGFPVAGEVLLRAGS